MSEWDYSWDYGGSAPYDDWSWDAGATQPSAWDTFTGWGDNATQWGADYDPSLYENEGGVWNSVLGGLGSVGSFLGKNAGTLGPLLSGAGSIAGGAIGSNAANEAARLQAEALNRGIDLQTAQWLQQTGNLAPYLQAGQGGVAQLQQLAGREQPGAPGAMPAVQGSQYGLPSPSPGWQPRQFQRPDDVNAGAYQWNPQQGPRAGDYRYTPGQTPDAAAYRYTAGAVPTLSGQELLANDPGVAFRLAEGRKALESSAAARGGLLSGPTLAALQRQGQELSSQEYSNAFARAAQQAQLREQWGQAESQMGWQQAEAASRLREQVNQIASQQGWSQAQAEAVFREQMAQQSQAQNWGQALQGQQNAYTQGLGAEQWAQKQQEAYATQLYDRQAQQAQQAYGRDVYSNTTDYDRQQAAYKQQLAQYLLPWEQQSTLANLGGQAVGMAGTQGQNATNAIANLINQQGSAQAGGATNQANAWQNALQNVGGAASGYFNNQSYLQGLRSVLGGLNA